MLITSKPLSLQESTATSKLLTHTLKMSWYSHPNLHANGTKLNKLATLDFFFVGILIPWFASICANSPWYHDENADLDHPRLVFEHFVYLGYYLFFHVWVKIGGNHDLSADVRPPHIKWKVTYTEGIFAVFKTCLTVSCVRECSWSCDMLQVFTFFL